MDIKNIIKNKRLGLGLTMKELAVKVGVSEATVSRWESGDIENMKRDKVAALAKALDISPGVIMGWEAPAESRFPILGSVACGEPILMTGDIESYISHDVNADFVLRAQGDSMKDARINDGDLVFVRKQPTVSNGQIAVVAIDDEATLKRFYRYGDLIVLRSCNPAYQDIEIGKDDGRTVAVLGLAVAVFSLID